MKLKRNESWRAITLFGCATSAQPCGLKMRRVDGGFFASFESGRIGRCTKLPPQFGRRPPSLLSAQSRQKVHSNEQITASAAGGKSLSQHSQLGRSSSICHLARLRVGRNSVAHCAVMVQRRARPAEYASIFRLTHPGISMRPNAPNVDENTMHRYMRRHDRDAHFHTAPP